MRFYRIIKQICFSFPPVKVNTNRSNRMSQEAIKSTEKAGTTISKEKLIEVIRKSPNKQFSYSQSPNSKLGTVVIQIS